MIQSSPSFSVPHSPILPILPIPPATPAMSSLTSPFTARSLLFAACTGSSSRRHSSHSSLHSLRATSATGPAESVSAATAQPAVRKRVRPHAPHASSDPSSTPSPQPARGSVAGINAAISGGTLRLLPELVARDLSTLSYGSILRSVAALVKAGHWHGVVDVYETASKSEGLKVRFTTRLYTDLFFALMKLGLRNHAIRAYEEWANLVDEGLDGRLLGPRAYNFLFVLLSRVGLVDEAMDVRANCAQNGFYLNRYSYNAFLNACAKSYRIADAFETLREMAESNVLPDVVSFNVLIACCVRSGDLDIALGILHRMKDWGIRPDIYSYNSVINGLRKSKMLEEAFELVAQMERDAAGGEDVPLVTDIAQGGARKQKESGVEQQDVEKSGSPDARPLIQALSTARRASFESTNAGKTHVAEGQKSGERGEREEAGVLSLESTNESGDGSNQVTETEEKDGDNKHDFQSVTGVSPDLVTYNTLISGLACEDSPDFLRAVEVKKHMESRGIISNEVSYNALMAVAARANKIQAAFDIYDDMISKSLKPNCECFTTLITLCGRANMIDRAFQVHDHMIASGIKPSVITFNALLTACRCSKGHDSGDAALRVLTVMRETPGCTPDVITYSTIIDALGRSGRFGKVREVLDEMSSVGVEPNLVTYTSVISALTRAGDLEGALRVLSDMEAHGIRPNVYTFSSLIHGAGRRGQFRKAFEMLGMMRSRGIHASRVTYSMLLQLALKSGERELLDCVVRVLVEDKRLEGTEQLERIIGLSRDPEVFDGRRGKRIYGLMNQAVGECVAMPKARGADRKDRSVRERQEGSQQRT